MRRWGDEITSDRTSKPFLKDLRRRRTTALPLMLKKFGLGRCFGQAKGVPPDLHDGFKGISLVKLPGGRGGKGRAYLDIGPMYTVHYFLRVNMIQPSRRIQGQI